VVACQACGVTDTTSGLPMFLGSQVAAARWMRAVVCVALLVCVLVIVILPQVDLPPTTLQARRIVHITLSQLAVLTLVLAVRCHIPPLLPELEFLNERPFQALPSRLSTMCVRLC
jgi:hypothetical protein